VAELVFFSGTMDCGKSTLALQMDYNHAVRGRAGLIFTKLDEADGPASALAATTVIGRPVSCICDGQRVPEDIHPVTDASLVERFLAPPAGFSPRSPRPPHSPDSLHARPAWSQSSDASASSHTSKEQLRGSGR